MYPVCKLPTGLPEALVLTHWRGIVHTSLHTLLPPLFLLPLTHPFSATFKLQMCPVPLPPGLDSIIPPHTSVTSHMLFPLSWNHPQANPSNMALQEVLSCNPQQKKSLGIIYIRITISLLMSSIYDFYL